MAPPAPAPTARGGGQPEARPGARWDAPAVFLGTLALTLPGLGNHGFWDCWEPHYAEVARQMSVRGDFISLFWPGSPLDAPTFWSKPVFTFWIEAIAFRIANLARPDSLPGEMALSSAPEWACRVPMAIFGALGVLGVYLFGARLLGRRAGLLAALVCATAPLYLFVSRQALTDMPFVGPMTLALGLGAGALLGEDAALGRRRIGFLTVPRHPLFAIDLALLALLVVPQLVGDAAALRAVVPLGGRRLVVPGPLLMAPYAALLAWLLRRLARAERRSQLELGLAYILLGVAGLAKGLVGVGLPAVVLLTYAVGARDARALRRAEIGSGILALVVVAFPWYHAMLVRHGLPFWSEFFGDNHWRRLVIGRHGDVAGQFDYYLRELGYGMGPFCALAAVAVLAALGRPAEEPQRRGRALVFALAWALASYGIVSVSRTKFHHYILPAVPPLALLCGWLFDQGLGRERPPRAIGLLCALFGAPLLLLCLHDLTVTPQAAQRLLWLFDYDYIYSAAGRAWPAGVDARAWLVGFGIAAALATAALGGARLRRTATAALGLGALGLAIFLGHRFVPELSPNWSQKHLLGTYYRLRGPGDRLVAWEMYWRGETFYSQNEIFDPRLPPEEKTVFIHDAGGAALKGWLGRHAGRRVYFLLDRGRLGTLRSLLPAPARADLTVVDDTNNKFLLARAAL